jgi:hypothetical protein
MVIAEIKLFELLKAKLGEKEAEAFVQVLEKQVDEKLDDFRNDLASKEFVVAELAKQKAELIKWMFIFWVGQVGVLVAILSLFFRHS